MSYIIVCLSIFVINLLTIIFYMVGLILGKKLFDKFIDL